MVVVVEVTTVAFIPARGGSKRIPCKNMRTVNGLTLVERAIYCAAGAGIDRVIVSSDDLEILALAEDTGAIAWRRPSHLATDIARIEDAMLVTDLGNEDNIVVLLQPTSPLRSSRHVVEAVRMIEDGWDSACSVSVAPELYFGGRLRGFEFRPDRSLHVRRRTQDLGSYAYENGAVYATTVGRLRQTRSRMSGRIGAVVMEGWSGLDVDDEDDLYVAEWLAKRLGVREISEEGYCEAALVDVWDGTSRGYIDPPNVTPEEVLEILSRNDAPCSREDIMAGACACLDREDTNDDPC